MNLRLKLLSAAAVAYVAACSTTPPRNAMLDDAHRLVDQASASTEVQRSAQAELLRARETLGQADRSWDEHHDTAQTNHDAYLAMQRAQIALNVAAQRSAEARVQSAGAERERLRADAKTREAQLARQEAQSAQAQAQSAQAQMQSAQAQAQFAQTQAQNAQAAALAERERANQLQRELAQLAATPTDHGMVVMLQDVLFDVGQATLRSGAQSRLDQLAAVLQHYPERRVLVEGFTDSTGNAAANVELSRERAEAVRQALLTRGVSADRIDVRGHGEARPLASNGTAAGRQQNRRVEVVFSDDHGQFAAAMH